MRRILAWRDRAARAFGADPPFGAGALAVRAQPAARTPLEESQQLEVEGATLRDALAGDGAALEAEAEPEPSGRLRRVQASGEAAPAGVGVDAGVAALAAAWVQSWKAAARGVPVREVEGPDEMNVEL